MHKFLIFSHVKYGGAICLKISSGDQARLFLSQLLMWLSTLRDIMAVAFTLRKERDSQPLKALAVTIV